jgi:hypothetical protein
MVINVPAGITVPLDAFAACWFALVCIFGLGELCAPGDAAGAGVGCCVPGCAAGFDCGACDPVVVDGEAWGDGLVVEVPCCACDCAGAATMVNTVIVIGRTR